MGNHFKIIVPFYNVEKWIKICIRSIKKQTIQDFQCVLIDDASTDNTVDVVKEEISNDDRFVLIENVENLGALENIHNAINFSNPNDDDVIVNLDGDDWFANPNVLATLNSYYTGDCLITYGSHVIYPGGARSKFCQSPVPDHVIENNTFRENPWMTSALRTFKYKLWRRIKVDDLRDLNGNFYKTTWDMAYMFPMLEMAGHHSRFVKEIVYVYNQHDHNDHVVPEKRRSQLANEAEIRKRKKYDRIQWKQHSVGGIDKLYYINLDKRKDRRQHIEQNVLPFINISSDLIQRIPAVDHTSYNLISQRGAGCSLSHISIWRDAIAKGYKKIIIMEDDFELLGNGAKMNDVLGKLESMNFSICNLGYNNISPLVNTHLEGFYRCNNIQTTSCYVANVEFLKVVLPHIEQATQRLMNGESYQKNAIDQAWKIFQNREDWIVSERVGKQKGSISDIEQRKTDYGV